RRGWLNLPAMSIAAMPRCKGNMSARHAFIPRPAHSDGNKSAIASYLLDDDPKSAGPLARQAGGVPRVSRPERLARMGGAERAAQCQSVGRPHERNGRLDPALLVSDVMRHACSATGRLEWGDSFPPHAWLVRLLLRQSAPVDVCGCRQSSRTRVPRRHPGVDSRT